MTTCIRRLAAFIALLVPATSLHAQTGLTKETWTNLPQSDSIIVLQQKGISMRAADATGTVTDANLAGPTASKSGTRLRGSITPALTDTYTFWISGKDNVALWISEDASRFNKKLVCYNLEATNASEWDKHADQKSIPIQLTGGQSYYLEAQVMDKSGGGHLEVAWRGQNGRYALDLNGATATQSSTYGTSVAALANNGDFSQMTRTQSQANSWIQIDFGQDREINQVVLYNGTWNQAWLSNFRISVLDANNVELVGQDFFTTSGSVVGSLTWNLPASQPTARKIKVQLKGYNLSGNGTLMVSEIEAYGNGLVSGQIEQRGIIPQAYLNTLAADADDANGNNLSDAWEVSTGLNSSALPGALLEYGDPDNDGLSNYQEQYLGSNPLAKEALANGLTRYIWMGINGSTVSAVTSNAIFYSYPNAIDHVPGIDDPVINRKKLGARYRGSIIAPVTGDYRFWVCGNGGGAELWLADGSVIEPGTANPLTNRFGKKRIATSYFKSIAEDDFDYSPTQRSALIHLVQGQEYYIELLRASQSDFSLGHASVAWQTPGGSRVIIPAANFLSNEPLESDADDDNLPDAWETAKSLSPTDNGYTSLNNGEYGDPDGDSLNNLQEYQLGTNPKSADSDGDGYSDADEVNVYGSDPTTSNNLAPVAISLPNLNQYTSATGSWSTNSNGSLVANDRRGALTYTFIVTEPGVHEVRVGAGLVYSPSWYTKYFDLSLTIDGNSQPFARDTLKSFNQSADTMVATTPWLAAGTHTISIYHHNFDAGFRLRVDSIAIKRLGGTDLDENGIPDWIETKAAEENALTRIATSSRTSPASIEGITEQVESVVITSLAPGAAEAVPVTVTQSINDSFFADVVLDEAGSVTVDASFVGGLVTESHSITWAATNLFDAFTDNTLHIRAGDSLRLDAWSGASADGQPFTVTLNGTLLADANQNTTHTSGVPFASTFTTAGSYTLVATHGGQNATVTLEVHAADFGSSHVVAINKIRAWTPTTLDAASTVQADEHLVFTETGNGTPRTFDVKAEEPINRYVIARLPEEADGAPGAILARGTVHPYELASTSQTGDAQVVTQYADGTYLMRSTIVGVNLPPNLLIELTIKYQGTLFTNGSMVLELHPEDFDVNGIATIYFEASETTTSKLCHFVRTYIEP